MVHAHGGDFQAGRGDELTQRTLPLFFEVLRTLLGAGVTLVAEAAFQDRLWRPGLEPVVELAELRIVNCVVDPAVSYARATERGERRQAHGDSALQIGPEQWASGVVASFERISLPAPSIEVDTTDGYAPALQEIVAFVDRPAVSA